MGVLKKIAISTIILPFLSLTLSFCCFKMMTASAHGMSDSCSGMAISATIQHSPNSHGFTTTSPASKFQCEQLTESYDKAGLKNVDAHKLIFNNPKFITFHNQTFTSNVPAVPRPYYHSPPKIVQNSLPLYLQLSVLRI